jgi:hypothetical protein
MHKTLVAGLAFTVANALLVVPDADMIIDSVPFEVPAETQSRSIDVACPSCPALSPATLNVPTHLELDFTVEQGDRLMLNGLEIFPEPPLYPLEAVQASDQPHASSEAVSHVLGYNLVAQPVGGEEDGSAELFEVSIQVIEVGDVFVDQVPAVVARVIRLEDGTLMLVSLEAQDVVTPLPVPEVQCQTTLCKLQDLFKENIQTIKSKINKHCGGRKHPGASSSRPHGHHGHGDGHGHNTKDFFDRKHHSLRHLLRNIASHILLPVFIGVVAGVSASILGMIFGILSVWLWRVVVRRQPAFPRGFCPRRCRRSPKTSNLEAASDDEKTELMVNEATLPPYADEGAIVFDGDAKVSTV